MSRQILHAYLCLKGVKASMSAGEFFLIKSWLQSNHQEYFYFAFTPFRSYYYYYYDLNKSLNHLILPDKCSCQDRHHDRNHQDVPEDRPVGPEV